MATKFKAVCKDCNFRGFEYIDPIMAKRQRNKHQRDTQFTHEVGIEIIEEIRTLITSADLDNPQSTTDKKGL